MNKTIIMVIFFGLCPAVSNADPRWPNNQERNTYYSLEREEFKNQKKENEKRAHELITLEQEWALKQKNEQLFQDNKHLVMDLEGKNQQ